MNRLPIGVCRELQHSGLLMRAALNGGDSVDKALLPRFSKLYVAFDRPPHIDHQRTLR